MRTRDALLIAWLLAPLTAAGVPAASATQGTPAGGPSAETRVYELPGDDVYPNGIAVDAAANAFYVGNTEDGTVLRGDLETGEMAVFSEGGADDRGPVFGMELDEGGRLYLAARPDRVFVYDTADGALLGRFATGREESRLQEIALAPDGAAYLTDAADPVLYRIPPGAAAGAGTGSAPTAELDPFLDFTGTAFAYQDGADLAGINADGIVATRDGAYLLIVQPNTGKLYRVAVATREVVAVDLGGATLERGNGMDLAGQTLYVVRIEDGLVVPVTMAEDFASGVVGEPVADPTFDRPTAIALVGDGTALVANHQASPPDPAELPFVVTRLVLPTAP